VRKLVEVQVLFRPWFSWRGKVVTAAGFSWDENEALLPGKIYFSLNS